MDKQIRLNQEQILQCIRNHRDLNEILSKQKDHSSQELFDEIERVTNNMSNESKESQESKSNSDTIDRAIKMFAEPKVILYKKENSLASDQIMEQISQVFNNKSFDQKVGSNLSTEISNEPCLQLGSSRQSLLTSGSETERRKRKTISEEESHYFVVRLEDIINYLDERTTIMIKNIPNKYTVQMLQDLIDLKHHDLYDFLYLPIDFKNKCNMGYAFINFIHPLYIVQFYKDFHDNGWPHFNSEKICELRYARIQGRQALVQHFQFSSVMNQKDKKLKPVIVPQSELSRIHQLIQVNPSVIFQATKVMIQFFTFFGVFMHIQYYYLQFSLFSLS
ncbi:unnamed protein product [Paramecium primaurelia]|uniref:Mei2-like C-terminal RNA recognition motif domain-containing protein n=1 Tax=Paramecium primaurelia TaxID=5886 RepID=A0A8S1N6L9_PARPR|nr:unnamed protein product [Paramecium primaurelia]